MSYYDRINSMITQLEHEVLDEVDRDYILAMILRILQMQLLSSAGEAIIEQKDFDPKEHGWKHCDLCRERLGFDPGRAFNLGNFLMCWGCARAYGYRDADG